MIQLELPITDNIINKTFDCKYPKLYENKSPVAVRNDSWETSLYIPDWVNIENVGLDQFFTRQDVAQSCWESLCYNVGSIL
jgi:hypothetical protein